MKRKLQDFAHKQFITYLIVAFIPVVILVIVVVAVLTPHTAITESSVTTAVVGNYKDGQYAATGGYNSPGGVEKLDVTLTLKNNVITAASVIPQATDPNSKKYQMMFASGCQGMVIGKDISTVNLTKVSGSSLTSQGFNDALQQIEQQAQA